APRRAGAPGAWAEEAAASGPLDGVSLSGGEPFDQADGLARFLDALRARPGLGGLTALAFTGYRLGELRRGPPAHRALLARLDLVIDGAYRSELASELPLRGSSNQRLVALSPAGERLRAAAEAAGPARFEVVIAGDGEVLFTGFPPAELVARVRGRLAGDR
ncbi:MAG: 4Fe-4S cluster-binding domain-containing protein, partial [Deferrisomatales bacterium]